MAFNPAPTAVWAGYTSDGTTITIPIASIPGFTAAQADADSGDWRALIVAICEQLWAYQENLAEADKPVATVVSEPVEATIFNQDRITYNFDFYNVKSNPSLLAEL